ncbi:LamG domain-containing protein [Streptomyces niphimycinicus]|uniref:LamG domain-containing protein n=1 Tax=Streptomyces niphimycinicus TaxID=2842201 RepID=UPI00263BCF74|nr:LamG domain-containing protein [Streptomyces niphimycinicus]
MLYGPVVLAGAYGGRTGMTMPRLDRGSVAQSAAGPMRFSATASGESVPLLPVARVHHQHFNVYWLTGQPPTPPPAFAAWHRFDETSGTAAADATGRGKTARLTGGASWTAGGTGGAVALNGTDGHIVLADDLLADDLLAGARAYTLATWIRLDGTPAAWTRIFDIGTGVTADMFLTPVADSGKLRFAITAGGGGAEQRIEAAPLPTGQWAHVAVAYGTGTAVLYVGARGGTQHRRHRRARPLRQPHPRRLPRQVAVPGPVPEGRVRRLPRVRKNTQRE